MKWIPTLALILVFPGISPARADSTAEEPEKIIDGDDFVAIAKTDVFPWSAVVWLRGHYDHKNNKCTGALVASNVVLTAAHCLYDKDDDAWALSIDVAPGKVGKQEPFGKLSTEWYLVAETFVTADSFDEKKHDWGLVVLPEHIGWQTGWFRIDMAETAEFFAYPLHIASYPDDDDCTDCPYDGRTLFYDTDKAFYVADLFVDHLVDTLSGSSGAGIWMEKSCDLPQLVAVHRGGYTSGEENTSTRLIPEVVEEIVATVIEHDGAMFCPGYEGADGCCMVGNPCGLESDGLCNCEGVCVWDTDECAGCVPDCTGRLCGPDGCGGNCGPCQGPTNACCLDEVCSCVPTPCFRMGRECGEWGNGCGEMVDCGTCDAFADSTCENGTCICVPDCDGLECGPDGCGGVCGTCDDGLECTEDSCLEGACGFAPSPFFCIIEDTCLPSGTENPENPCSRCRPALEQQNWSNTEDGIPCGAGLFCLEGTCSEPTVDASEETGEPFDTTSEADAGTMEDSAGDGSGCTALPVSAHPAPMGCWILLLLSTLVLTFGRLRVSPFLFHAGVIVLAGCGNGSTTQDDAASVDPGITDLVADTMEVTPIAPHPPELCTFYLTGELDLQGTDADGDGVSNGWDVCPNNPADWLDSDRDGIGNGRDSDVDGDGEANDLDPDIDGDGVPNDVEVAQGTDPSDPSSIPGLPVYEYDAGTLDDESGWYRGDLHVHSEYSHDSLVPVSDWIDGAVTAGLDYLAVTDHRNIDHLFDPDWHSEQVLLLSGIEWGGPGHGNIFGLRTDNPCDYDDYDQVLASWTRARLQGAVQSLNHYGDDPDYWDAFFAERPGAKEMLDAFEVWNTWWGVETGKNRTSIARWDALLDEGLHIAAVGGSDTHYTLFPLGFPTTVVHATSLSPLAILEGIRKGRTYIVNPYPYTIDPGGGEDGTSSLFSQIGPWPELIFEADGDDDGTFEAMIGDTVPLGTIRFHVIVVGARGPVEVYRNGTLMTSYPVEKAGGTREIHFSDTPSESSRYRIEMRLDEEPESELLLLSSHIYAE